MSNGLGVRTHRDRDKIVVTFSDEGEANFYAVLTPAEAILVADHLRAKANAILQIRTETVQ